MAAEPFFRSLLGALLLGAAALAIGVLWPSAGSRTASANGPIQCPGAQFVLPSNGQLGWTYLEPGDGEWTPQTPAYSRDHTGIDILGTTDDDIYAADSGQVTSADGVRVWIWHPQVGVETFYTHLSQTFVSVGQMVTRGQVIGKKGNKGTKIVHLHFSVKKRTSDERLSDSVYDPSALLGANVNHNNGAIAFQKDVSQWCLESAVQSPVSLRVHVTSEAVPTGKNIGYVLVEMRNPGSPDDIAQRELYVDSSGTSEAWALPAAVVVGHQYDILAKGRQTLRRKMASYRISAANVTAEFNDIGPLLAGDLNGDNKVNAFDHALLLKHYQPRDPGCADFNRDGTVNSFDHSWMLRNYNQVGDGGTMPAANDCVSPTLPRTGSNVAGQTESASESSRAALEGGASLLVSADGSNYDVNIGDQINVIVTVWNDGTVPLDGVGVLIRFDPGVFAYLGGENCTTRVSQAGASFRAAQSGPPCATSATPGFTTVQFGTDQVQQGYVEVSGIAQVGSPELYGGELGVLHFRAIRAIDASSIYPVGLHIGSTTQSHAVEDGTLVDRLGSAFSLVTYRVHGSDARPVPTGQLSWPPAGANIFGPTQLTATLNSDAYNGVFLVEFGATYADGSWHNIGASDGANGVWAVTWDPSGIAPQAVTLSALVHLWDGQGSWTAQVSIQINGSEDADTVTSPSPTPISAATATPVPVPSYASSPTAVGTTSPTSRITPTIVATRTPLRVFAPIGIRAYAGW